VSCTFGQVELKFNGSSASPLLLQPGDVALFELNGPPNAPFAAMISPEPAFVVTPYGLLLASPFHPEAAIVYDGFDPWHPAFGFSKLPGTGAPFTQVFVPFVGGGIYSPGGYTVQAIVGDPMAPSGLTLSNAIILEYDRPPPQVTGVEPNFAAPLSEVMVVGVDFDPNPANDTVRLNDLVCPVISATATAIVVSIPANATSGPMTVETPDGISFGANDYLSTWLAIAPAGFVVETEAPPIVNSPLTILGDIVTGEQKNFVVHVDAGNELVAELYVFDPFAFKITGYQNPVTNYFDPFVRVRRNPDQPYTVLTDDDSGPSVSAGIGLSTGSPRYVASASEDLVVQVDSQSSVSGGPFMLVLWTRPAVNLPVTVQAMAQSDAKIGDLVTVLGTGFDPSQPDMHSISLNGAVTSPTSVTLGSVSFIVPEGTKSGPVQVVTPAGASGWDEDNPQTWLCIHGFTEQYEFEGTIGTIAPGGVIRGQIWPSNDIDDYLIDLVAGQQIAIEVHAIDAGAGTITSSSILAPTPVDPEIRVVPGLSVAPLLGFDQNSGPGLSAGLGLNPSNAPFTAPSNGQFKIRVSSFFGWSRGDYLLVVNPLP
jgi:hypothetical protein